MGYQFFVGLSRLVHNIEGIFNSIKVYSLRLEMAQRIVRAADDSTDLFTANYLKQIYSSYKRSLINVKEIFGAVRTFDDAIGRIYSLALKIKALVVEAASATPEGREQIQAEINEYVRNIKKIISQTEYDGYKVLNGDAITVYYGGRENQYLIINGDKNFKNRLQFLAEAGNGTDKATLGFETIDKTTTSGVVGAGTKDNPFVYTHDYNPDTGQGLIAYIWKRENGTGACVETHIDSTISILQCFGKSASIYINQYYAEYQYDPTTDSLTVYSEKVGDGSKTQTFYFSSTSGSSGSSSTGTTTSSENAAIKAYDSLGGEYSVNLELGTVEIQVASALSTLEKSIENIETYLKNLDRVRGYYGALENKLQNIVETNAILIDNWREGENLIRNTDLASEYANLTREKIKSNLALAVLSSQLQLPHLVLRILNAPVGA